MRLKEEVAGSEIRLAIYATRDKTAYEDTLSLYLLSTARYAHAENVQKPQCGCDCRRKVGEVEPIISLCISNSLHDSNGQWPCAGP